jgi:hypothetical protein
LYANPDSVHSATVCERFDKFFHPR